MNSIVGKVIITDPNHLLSGQEVDVIDWNTNPQYADYSGSSYISIKDSEDTRWALHSGQYAVISKDQPEESPMFKKIIIKDEYKLPELKQPFYRVVEQSDDYVRVYDDNNRKALLSHDEYDVLDEKEDLYRVLGHIGLRQVRLERALKDLVMNKQDVSEEFLSILSKL